MIIVISGPTASGKSSLAINLGQYKDIAIINADALQLYEGLPILSAQPSIADHNLVKHYLYSCLKPYETASAGMWLKLVKSAVDEVREQNKIPVIVGGSGMYISRLFYGMVKIPQVEEIFKKQARALFLQLGIERFRNMLIAKDHDERRVMKLDKQRLIRAYEVFLQSGKTIFFWQNQDNELTFNPKELVHINLEIDRKILYANCNLRFEQMLERGAIEEVRNLIDEGVTENSSITKTLGFSEIKDLLEEKISYEQAIINASQKTRNYAKRQMTWFRNQFDDKYTFQNTEDALSFLKNYKHEI